MEPDVKSTHTIEFSEKLYKITVGVIGLAALFLVAQVFYQFSALPQNAPHEVSISGEGKAIVKPDIAMISFGVRAEAPKSQDAVNESNRKMNEVIKAVKALGIEDKDIQTTYYNLSPIYGYDVLPMAPDRYSYPVPSSKVTGYSLEQQVQVKIRNFDNINSVLDAAATNGANVIGSLQFTVDDMEKVRAEAREKAIAKAKEKADALFKQSGLRMGKLVNMSEGYGYVPPMPYGVGGAGPMLDKAVAPEIQSGQMEITTTVTLTYQVK